MSENAMHDLIIENRRRITLTGITDVESFDEETITATGACGEISIRGSSLRISSLSVETGDMLVEGQIDAVIYSEAKAGGSFLSRVFR